MKGKAKKHTDRSVLMLRPFRRIGSILPDSMIGYFAKRIRFAGIRQDARVWLGIRMLFGFIMGGVLLAAFLVAKNPIPTAWNTFIALSLLAGGMVLSSTLFFFILYFRVAERASALEKILPDFLLLTVSNLRAGMTPSKAFIKASRPGFGALHDEVQLSAAKASSNISLEEALNEMGGYFDSKVFRRTLALFGKGMHSGGQLASLLTSCADEVQRIQDLRAELSTTTRTYTLFLGFITVIIMPFLLSISTLFVKIFLSMQPSFGGDPGFSGAIPMFSGQIFITHNEMTIISLATLTLTSLLVAALSGIIKRGKAFYGAKYFPILAAASIAFFYVAQKMLESILYTFHM